MKIISVFLVALILLLIFATDTYAQVLINEFSANDSVDWVELYANQDTDISGWILHDSATTKIGQIPQNTVIGPTATSGSFLMVNVSTRLNSDKDQIKLFMSDDSTKIDEVDYGDANQVCAPLAGQSAGRFPDGSNFIDRLSSQTPNGTNTWDQSHACPSPTPSPTNSPTPNPTNSPTQAPSATPVPTASPIPIATKKPVVTPSPNTPESVLGDATDAGTTNISDLRNSLESGSETPSSTPASQKNASKFPIIAGAFVISGIGLVGFAGYMFFKKQKESSSGTIIK